MTHRPTDLQQPGHAPSRRGRRGMSLVEVMVVISLLLLLIVVMIPSLNSVFQLQQRKSAQALALTYERLHDEAVLRNRTYRILFYLDENRYVVEAGEPEALVAATPEDRERFENERREKLALMDDEEKAKFLNKNKQPFESLGTDGRMEVQFPPGVRLAGVYTPQYGKMVEPGSLKKSSSRKDGDDEEEEKLIVYSYVMSDGFTEHTVIWLSDESDPTNGWTIEVEPLTGVVTLHGEVLDPRDRYEFVPKEGPSLPN